MSSPWSQFTVVPFSFPETLAELSGRKCAWMFYKCGWVGCRWKNGHFWHWCIFSRNPWESRSTHCQLQAQGIRQMNLWCFRERRKPRKVCCRKSIGQWLCRMCCKEHEAKRKFWSSRKTTWVATRSRSARGHLVFIHSSTAWYLHASNKTAKELYDKHWCLVSAQWKLLPYETRNCRPDFVTQGKRKDK